MCSVIYPLHRCVSEYDNRTMLKYAGGIVIVSQLQDNETSFGLLLYFTVLTNLKRHPVRVRKKKVWLLLTQS